MIISVDTKEAFDKVILLFMIFKNTESIWNRTKSTLFVIF